MGRPTQPEQWSEMSVIGSSSRTLTGPFLSLEFIRENASSLRWTELFDDFKARQLMPLLKDRFGQGWRTRQEQSRDNSREKLALIVRVRFVHGTEYDPSMSVWYRRVMISSDVQLVWCKSLAPRRKHWSMDFDRSEDDSMSNRGTSHRESSSLVYLFRIELIRHHHSATGIQRWHDAIDHAMHVMKREHVQDSVLRC